MAQNILRNKNKIQDYSSIKFFFLKNKIILFYSERIFYYKKHNYVELNGKNR